MGKKKNKGGGGGGGPGDGPHPQQQGQGQQQHPGGPPQGQQLPGGHVGPQGQQRPPGVQPPRGPPPGPPAYSGPPPGWAQGQQRPPGVQPPRGPPPGHPAYSGPPPGWTQEQQQRGGVQPPRGPPPGPTAYSGPPPGWAQGGPAGAARPAGPTAWGMPRPQQPSGSPGFPPPQQQRFPDQPQQQRPLGPAQQGKPPQQDAPSGPPQQQPATPMSDLPIEKGPKKGGKGRGKGPQEGASQGQAPVPSSASSDAGSIISVKSGSSMKVLASSDIKNIDIEQGPKQGGRGKGPQQGASRGQTPVPSSASSDAGSIKSAKSGSSMKVLASSDIKNIDIKDLLEIKKKKQIDKKKKLGKPIKVAVNHMPLKLANYQIQVVHYDVTFDPEKPKFLLRPAIKKFFEEHLENGRVPVFDGNKNVFSNGYLKDKTGKTLNAGLSRSVTVYNEESMRDKEIMVTIAPVNLINMDELVKYQTTPNINPMMAKLVIDVAMRCSLYYSNNKLVESSRKFFSEPQRVIQLGDGVELWHGSYQAAVLGWKPYINIDITHKGFYSTNTIEQVIGDVFRKDPRVKLDAYGLKDLSAFLKGLKVDYMIPGQPQSRRVFRVNGAVNPPGDESFKDDNGKTWTVAQYFMSERKYRIQNPSLPCLWVGSREKKVYVPGELCRISPGQPNNKKLNENQTSQMVKNATCDTQERRRRIMDTFDKTGLGNEKNPFLKEFGISISGKFEEVEGRILQAPDVTYAGGRDVRVEKGQWRALNFLTTRPLEKWAILSLHYRVKDGDMKYISEQFVKSSRNVGMEIQPAAVLKVITSRPPNLQKEIEIFLKDMKSQGMQLIMVVVPDAGDVYAKVKSLAEITVGVLTQCIKGKTVNKLNPATVGNILLKVNAKLNGVNHELSSAQRPPCLKNPIMVVGADVTHPSPGQTNIPSIAAVAASFDPKAFKYNMIWRMQPKGEMIVDLEEIMILQLKHFQNTARREPQKIIFYRDGVSEGEIQKVMSVEIGAIRRACKSLNPNYQPAITFVVVQKRHHTRFFPVDTRSRDIYDTRNFNLPAGTIIDTEIVHPFETEFLLLSHASILGTARPTKYRLVHDDSDFGEEELEQLTYYLCHLFSRCTRSVSYPAPTYYAHLAAFRARHYIDAVPIRNLMNLVEEQRLRNTVQNLQFTSSSPMFFV